MTDIVRVGVVGAGNISHNAHLPAYKSVTNAKVVATLTSKEQKRRQRISTFRITMTA